MCRIWLLILQAAGIYIRKMSKGILLAVCSRDSWQVLWVCGINRGEQEVLS